MQHWWHPHERPRRAHALLRRPRLAAVRRGPLRPRHRRRLGARRVRAVPHDARARARTSTRSTTCRRSTDEHGSVYEHCLRALRRACTTGRARPAADRQRRLERRHEPRRASRAGARASGWRGSSSTTLRAFADARRRRGATRRSPASCGAQADALRGGGRGARLGRRVVSPRLLRRRHAARLARRATSAASTRSRRAGA